MSASSSSRADSTSSSEAAVPALGDCVSRTMRSYFRAAGEQTAGGLYRMVMSEVEAPLLREVLRHTGGNLSRAAELLGLSRATLRKKMAEHGID